MFAKVIKTHALLARDAVPYSSSLLKSEYQPVLVATAFLLSLFEGLLVNVASFRRRWIKSLLHLDLQDRMSGSRSRLDRQLGDAVDKKDVVEIQRLVKQERADVNCRDGFVCCRENRLLFVLSALSYLFPRKGLFCSGQLSTITMML